MFPIPDTILDSLPDPVILVEANRKVMAANHAARDLFGDDLEGRDLARALRHPDALEAVDAVIAGEKERVIELSLPVPVHRDFSVHVVSLPQGAEGATPLRAIMVFHDTTLTRRAEEMRADFVANVSHELRSPLSALIGIVETLRGAAADDADARTHFLEIMQREADRMARLINDLLSLSRVEVNEHIAPRDQVDIARLLGDVAELLSGKAATRGMEISVECPPDLPLVSGDTDELIQVFQNLIDNSIKYAREDTTIRISASPVTRVPDSGCSGVGVSVEDRGEGIPQEDIPRLTERFYRVDKARSRGLGGTGLGLAIVKHIVKRHRGRFNISSVIGEGTSATILLPVCHKTVTAT